MPVGLGMDWCRVEMLDPYIRTKLLEVCIVELRVVVGNDGVGDAEPTDNGFQTKTAIICSMIVVSGSAFANCVK